MADAGQRETGSKVIQRGKERTAREKEREKETVGKKEEEPDSIRVYPSDLYR